MFFLASILEWRHHACHHWWRHDVAPPRTLWNDKSVVGCNKIHDSKFSTIYTKIMQRKHRQTDSMSTCYLYICICWCFIVKKKSYMVCDLFLWLWSISRKWSYMARHKERLPTYTQGCVTIIVIIMVMLMQHHVCTWWVIKIAFLSKCQLIDCLSQCLAKVMIKAAGSGGGGDKRLPLQHDKMTSSTYKLKF